ncbi:MAG TPA: hypothetical protein VGM88_32965 [Kofleriaceae bacterium]
MSERLIAAAALLAFGCRAAGPATVATLHAACAPETFWDGAKCAPRGDGAAKVAAGKAALAKQDLDVATASLDAAAKAGPLDHATNVALWEQRGIAAAYADDEKTATTDFDMLLALDPAHFLSYTLSPKATFLFEKLRTAPRVDPAVDVTWDHGQRVNAPVPLHVDVVADPRHFLHGATLYVRTRGDRAWRATDVTLSPSTKLVLPAIGGTHPASLELYLRAYDDRHDEVLAWADAAHPREVPLRYDHPTPWYAKWWVITIAAVVVAAGTGAIVYETTIAPPDKVNGGVSTE